jgi:hypothetical protein
MFGHRAGLAAALLAVVAIFLYRNRSRQRQIVGLNIAFILLIAAGVWAGALIGGSLGALANGDLELLLACVGPVIGILLLYMARRRITADIELIRSMDRLR